MPVISRALDADEPDRASTGGRGPGTTTQARRHGSPRKLGPKGPAGGRAGGRATTVTRPGSIRPRSRRRRAGPGPSCAGRRAARPGRASRVEAAAITGLDAGHEEISTPPGTKRGAPRQARSVEHPARIRDTKHYGRRAAGPRFLCLRRVIKCRKRAAATPRQWTFAGFVRNCSAPAQVPVTASDRLAC